jgi:hypothetical protein
MKESDIQGEFLVKKPKVTESSESLEWRIEKISTIACHEERRRTTQERLWKQYLQQLNDTDMKSPWTIRV